MGEPIRMRVREGCRGGREQFTWNSIKEQEYKDRECYLGASTKVGMMGKFGRYYQHDWYARKRDTAESIDSERGKVKAYEEELMQEALGLKPKKLLLQKRQLTEEELKEFFAKAKQDGREAMGPQKKLTQNEFGEQVAQSNEDVVAIAARDAPIKGLGFASHRTAKLEEIKAATLGTVSKLEGSRSVSSTAGVKTEGLEAKVKKEEVEDGEGMHPLEADGLVADKPDGQVKKEEPRLMEVKRELEEPSHEQASKRRREADPSEERRRAKAEKKEKKQKKAEKKLKKLEKKEKKLLKKERKAAKEAKRLAKKAKKDGSASDSSSSSS